MTSLPPRLAVAFLFLASGAIAAEPTLTVPASTATMEIVVPMPPDAGESAGAWQLVGSAGETVAARTIPALTPEGTVDGTARRLVALIPPGAKGDEPRRFRLESVAASESSDFRVEPVDDKRLGVFQGDRPVLVYNHGDITCETVPEKDARRTRACFIHPLHGLRGEILTDNFPRDHYHHHGVFWTWPHVLIDETHYDLWADRGGLRQRFVEWLAREGGDTAAVVGVENGWFVDDRKVMIERVWIRTYRATDKSRAIDLEFVWIPVDRAITLKGAPGKSYGGLTVRFRPPAGKDPSTAITVDSGRTKGDLPDTPLAWADFTSKFDESDNPSGAAIFIAPDHPDFPPTWLTRHYGPMCIGWPGVAGRTFEPGEPIRLAYRLWIHDEAMTPEALRAAHATFKASREASWK